MHFNFWASIKPNPENGQIQVRQELPSHYHKPKHKNRSHNVVYGSITLKLPLWALETTPRQWLSWTKDLRQKCFFGTPYCLPSWRRCATWQIGACGTRER